MIVPRQTRIFIPPNPPYTTNIFETTFGKVIKPLIENTPPEIKIEWYFFSRYGGSVSNSASENCDITLIPSNFQWWPCHYHSIRFRYCIEDTTVNDFEVLLRAIVAQEGCAISDCRNYDLISDVGSGRHIGGAITHERQEKRAQLAVELYHSTSKLVLDAIEGPDVNGSFQMEINNDPQAELNSSFHVFHHLFCNITEVPLQVLFNPNNDIGSSIFPPPQPIVTAKKIRF
jgi:hypothetical protein